MKVRGCCGEKSVSDKSMLDVVVRRVLMRELD